MNKAVLYYIRNATAEQLVAVALDLAVLDEGLFTKLAGPHGLDVVTEYNIPRYGRRSIEAGLIHEMNEKNNKVGAIRVYRDAKVCDLAEAKYTVEHLMDLGVVKVVRPDPYNY